MFVYSLYSIHSWTTHLWCKGNILKNSEFLLTRGCVQEENAGGRPSCLGYVNTKKTSAEDKRVKNGHGCCCEPVWRDLTTTRPKKSWTNHQQAELNLFNTWWRKVNILITRAALASVVVDPPQSYSLEVDCYGIKREYRQRRPTANSFLACRHELFQCCVRSRSLAFVRTHCN